MPNTTRCGLLLLAAVVWLGGCQARPATQVFIGLATDLDAPMPLQLVTMKIERAVGTAGDYLPVDNGDLSLKWPINGLPDGRYELPGSLVAFDDRGDETKIKVTVEATAADSGEGRFIRRQTVLRLVREKTLFLRMGLTRICYDNADCPDTKTCIEGRCRSPEVESKELPIYEAASKPDLSFDCNSGTQFRNTTSKVNLVSPTATCSSPDQVCLEGTCYSKAVFTEGVTSAQRLEVEAQVSDAAGAPITGAELRLEDGPLSLVRKLRSPSSSLSADPGGTLAIATAAAGRYAVETRTSPLTTELRLTATAPGFVPEVVSIPYKPGVTRYLVPVVLFPLVEQSLPANQARSFTLEIGGRTATLQLGQSDREIRLRYGLVDGRFVPGQAVPSETGGLLQSVAALYLENVGQTGFPPGTEVTLGAASTAPVVGTEGEAGAYLLDLQGQWKKRSEAGGSSTGRLLPSGGGFWTIANRTAKPACVRGKIVRPDRTPCPGARVRLWGPQGVSSFDTSGSDGGFCGGAAQQDAAILSVAGTTRVIYVPPTTRVGVQCAQPESCVDIQEVVVDAPGGCDNAPADLAGNAAPGQACARTGECAGLASCYQGFCVSEGYLRVSMAWAVRSDFDVHVTLPGGRAINQQAREIEGIGRLDVEQCTQACPGDKHVESVVLSAKAPDGTYQAWVENFGGAAGGPAQLEVLVAGQRVVSQMVTVPPTPDGKSEVITFTVPAH